MESSSSKPRDVSTCSGGVCSRALAMCGARLTAAATSPHLAATYSRPALLAPTFSQHSMAGARASAAFCKAASALAGAMTPTTGSLAASSYSSPSGVGAYDCAEDAGCLTLGAKHAQNACSSFACTIRARRPSCASSTRR